MKTLKKLLFALILVLAVTCMYAINGYSESADVGVKVVVTVTVIIVACLAAVIIAKLVDRCYDRKTIADNGSDVSDNTRELIRARLSVIQFRKKEIKKQKKERALKVLRYWLNKVRERNANRESTINSKRPQGAPENIVITIDNAETEKKENGGGRTPRFPFFTGASLAGGAQKPPKTPRPISNTNLEHSISSSPVPKGRPVSSKSRVFPNVVLTNNDGNLPKVFTKLKKNPEKNGVVIVDNPDEALSSDKT